MNWRTKLSLRNIIVIMRRRVPHDTRAKAALHFTNRLSMRLWWKGTLLVEILLQLSWRKEGLAEAKGKARKASRMNCPFLTWRRELFQGKLWQLGRLRSHTLKVGKLQRDTFAYAEILWHRCFTSLNWLQLEKYRRPLPWWLDTQMAIRSLRTALWRCCHTGKSCFEEGLCGLPWRQQTTNHVCTAKYSGAESRASHAAYDFAADQHCFELRGEQDQGSLFGISFHGSSLHWCQAVS